MASFPALRTFCWLLLFAGFPTSLCCASDYPTASAITPEVSGGLVVLLGGGAGKRDKLAQALTERPGFVAQCLDTDVELLAKMRSVIEERRPTGRITVRRLAGQHLPYSDHMVNVLVMRKGAWGIKGSEVARVLTPKGLALIEDGAVSGIEGSGLVPGTDAPAGWKKLLKPWPKELDSWTHFAYDAAGGMVGRDRKVGFPEHVQWDAGPRWSRSHENISIITALVSDGGRIFYIVDEATAASVYLPPRVSLVARDAFNGILLWKQPIANWFTHLFKLKSGPHQLGRRLVAAGDKVYVTLGMGAPVSVLDAATGKVERVVAGSENTEEILYVNGKLVLLAHPFDPASLIHQDESTVSVFDADTGKRLWGREIKSVAASTLVSDGHRVYCVADKQIRCMAIADGADVWDATAEDKVKLATYAGPGLQVHKDVLIYCGQILAAFEAGTGRMLWKEQNGRASDYRSPTRVYVIDDLV